MDGTCTYDARDPVPGCILTQRRGPITHYMIALDGGFVVEYTSKRRGGRISLGHLSEMWVWGTPIQVKVTPYSIAHAQAVMTMAQSRIGESLYDLFTNNCEHFARWAFYGAAQSHQVRAGVGIALAGVALGAICLACSVDEAD